MEPKAKTTITVETVVNLPVGKVWKIWSDPKDIVEWSSPSADWHTPRAENDLRNEGKFKFTMAARDGSMSFDFEGAYSNIQLNKVIEYEIGDGRKVCINFSEEGGRTKVVETFEAEEVNTVEMQRMGWQAIMDSFKKYCEAQKQ